MALPEPVEKLWHDLEVVRTDVLEEVRGLSQAQADWKPGPKDWSIGEIVHHLTMAEIATGKLTTKLTREAEAAGASKPFPADVKAFPPFTPVRAAGAEAPPVVWPEHGKPIGALVSDMQATRQRSRQSIEKLGSIDPRPLTFKHFALGDLDLAQWWLLQAGHDGIHLRQIREVKAQPGFPKG